MVQPAPMVDMDEPATAMADMDVDEAESTPTMMDDEAEVEMAPEPMTAMDAGPMMLEPEMNEDEADEEVFAEELSLDLPDPVRAEPDARPVARIVDPMVEDDEPPLFAGVSGRDPAPQKSGRFFSLFGGRRSYEPEAAPAPQSRTPSAPQPQARQPEPAAQVEMEAAEDEDDLEIPSFLRRLAN
jgi:cell division protein FtsZ